MSRSDSRDATDQDVRERLLREELEDIRDENAKLRDIESQFWLLLNEKEDLKRELDTLRDSSKLSSSTSSGGAGKHATATTKGSTTNSSTLAQLTGGGKGLSQSAQEGLIAQLREENDTLSNAMKECMELTDECQR